ncbi:hypothetical protein Dimus_030533, partial [Dionaea muscipula]
MPLMLVAADYTAKNVPACSPERRGPSFDGNYCRCRPKNLSPLPRYQSSSEPVLCLLPPASCLRSLRVAGTGCCWGLGELKAQEEDRNRRGTGAGERGKSQIVQDELVKFGESMVSSSKGTRALALELCREFEEKFLRHITGGEVCMQYANSLAAMRMPFK